MTLTQQDLLTLAQRYASGQMTPAEAKKAEAALAAIIPEQARKSYKTYVYWTNGGKWLPGRFHTYLCDEVQRFIETETGNAYDILLIHTPPQHGKSETVTNALPSWFMGNWPDKKIINVSYNDETALWFTKANHEKIERFGKFIFGVEIDPTVDRANEFQIKGSRGYMISRGIGGGITSKGANLLLIDDPIKSPVEADSENERERQWKEWSMTLKGRLAAGAKVIIIMTRWHEDDLGGRILKNEPSRFVRVINLPCEAEENDLLGREIGEPLAPEIKKDAAWVRDIKEGFVKTETGTRAWNAQYQCRPTSAEGNMIKRDWWQRYDTAPDIVQYVMSVDAAFKDGSKNDFVSIQMWGKRGADAYLLDNDTRKMDFPETLRAIRNMKSRYPKCYQILVEDKANGSAIISMLRHEMTGIIAVNPEGGKESRVSAVLPAIEAHQVWLPKDKPWVHDFIEECSAFPNGKHDDQVDAMSQALKRLLFMGKHIPGEPQFRSRLFSFGKKDDNEMRLVDWN